MERPRNGDEILRDSAMRKCMKRYRVRRTRSAPGSVLDWSGAELLTDFICPWEQSMVPPTEFRGLWDDERFYFRFDCVDDDLVLAEGGNSMERVLGSDRVEIFLTPDLTLNPYFGFEMEPRGEVLAYRARFHRQFDMEWSCDGFEFSGHVEERRYRVHGSIALETLRNLDVLKPGAREIIAGVYRAEFSHKQDGSVHQGWMPWVNPQTERPDFHVPESFGVFELVG
jgi:hypothetical protein